MNGIQEVVGSIPIGSTKLIPPESDLGSMGRPQHNYRIHFEPEPEGGYTVTVPSLPGCVTWGRDYDDAVERARECIEGFLEALAKAGDPIPPGEPVEPPVDALIQVPLPTPA